MSEVKKGSEVADRILAHIESARVHELPILTSIVRKDLDYSIVIPEEKWIEQKNDLLAYKEGYRTTLEDYEKTNEKLQRIQKLIDEIKKKPIYSESWNINEAIGYEISIE